MSATFLNEAKEIQSEWSKTGLLEGIDNDYTRSVTSVILENQRLFNELSTDTSDIAVFKRISIPLIRRIYPQLIANKIVSVQPLLGPVGLVYYLRFRYSSNKGATRGADNNGGFPGDDANSLMQTAAGDANLDITYTSQQVENETTSTDDGVDTTSIFAPLERTPILGGTVTGTVYRGTTAIQTFVVSAAGTFTFADIGTVVGAKAQSSGSTLNLTTGEMVLTWTSAPSETNYAVVSYEVNFECQQDIPEINMALESEEVVAKSRKLKAVWSIEAQQDLRSQFNLEYDTEITSVMAQEINLEIDREILQDLRRNAGTVAAWDFSTAIGESLKERYETLYIKVTEVSNVIHRKTLRGMANWIVTSPEVASIFETSVAGFAPAPSETFTSSLGIQYVGTVNQRWRLYKDALAPRNQLLMGYKGDNYLDSGYFYMPYVPLIQTPPVVDPDSLFCTRKGLMTRYGKKLLREGAKFYARLNIANFNIA